MVHAEAHGSGYEAHLLAPLIESTRQSFNDFANIQNKGMRRFTLRGQRKVSAQWKLFTMVHNIEKVAGVAMRQ